MFQGGDIDEITYSNPDAGTGVFSPKGGEAFTFDTGGFTVNDDAQGIAGNGQAIYTKSRKRWSIEGPIAWDMFVIDELDVLQQLQASNNETQFTVTLVNGVTYSGKGFVVGEPQGDSLAATIGIKISGGGKMKKLG